MSIRLFGCALAVLALSAAGCGAGSAGGAADPDLSTESGVLSAEAQARGTSTADAVDACALIDDTEVRSLIGTHDRTPTPGNTGGDGGGCTWENQTDYTSVSVDIGRSGSAAGGTLPMWDPAMGPERPLPDGMRSLSGGSVDFVAGDRYSNVQVARVRGDADEQKAIELAQKVRAQL
jgi:Protein of unknown function (DUF3558)